MSSYVRFIATAVVLIACLPCQAQFAGLDAAKKKDLSSTARDSAVRSVEKAHTDTFDAFLNSQQITLAAARASIKPDLTEEKFNELSQSLNAFNRSLKVISTVRVPIPQSASVVAYDCIDFLSQQGATAAMKAEAPPADPFERNAPAAGDEQGLAATPQACPVGSIGIKRTTLAELISSPAPKSAVNPGLDRDALRNALGRTVTVVPPQGPSQHRYAHASALVANTGVHSRLNVWSPRVIDGDMSLSQVWVIAGDPDTNSLQTLEAGWQVMSFWQSPFSALFVYSTSDNYGSTGCYVTLCQSAQSRPETFKITTNKIIVGRPIPTQSQVGGNQAAIDLRWVRSNTGSWWLKVDGEWIGFYPASNFAGGALAQGAQYVDFGGEATGFLPTSEMGSGRFAASGKGNAAFQSHIEYLDASGIAASPTLRSTHTDPCYTIDLSVMPAPDDSPGTYFYFGGPGNRHFDVPPPKDESTSCIGG